MKTNNTNHDQQNTSDAHTALIPPHLAWPGVIVLLLVIGVGSSFAIVFAARSDGGAQVVENYYEKAIVWDSTSRLVRSSEAAGWQVSLAYVPSHVNSTAGNLEVFIVDRAGQPITGLTAQIKTFRPQLTQAVSTLDLIHDTSRAGTYQHTFPGAVAGLWDFEINAKQDTFQFRKVVRKELIF
ncbi:MAG: FixH family protein [Bacteroidota bacterium]